MQALKLAAAAAIAATVPLDAAAEFVRCMSKDGTSSVIRRDKCDSPDDVRTPVTVQSAIRAPNRPPAAAASAPRPPRS